MSQQYSRRTFLKAAGLSAGALALAACAAPVASPEGGSEPGAAAASELKFWTHSNVALTAYVEKKVEEYSAVNPDVAVEYTPTETAKYGELKITNAMPME